MSEETFRWVVAGGVVVVALFFAVMGMTSLALLMYLKRLMEKVEPILKAASPIAQHAQEVVAIVKPRLLKVTADVVKVSGDVVKISADATELSTIVVAEAKRYAELSKDVSERAKVKIARIDTAMDDTVDQVHEASTAMKTAVRRPLQHIEGVVAGVRTALSTYAEGGSRSNVYNSSQYRGTHDEEMFI